MYQNDTEKKYLHETFKSYNETECYLMGECCAFYLFYVYSYYTNEYQCQ